MTPVAAVGVPGPARLRLRLEDDRAVAGTPVSPHRWRWFQDQLMRELAKLMTTTGYPIEDEPLPSPMDVPPTINLDPMATGDIDIGLSRIFDLGGMSQLGYGPRPGWPPIADQIVAVPPGIWRVNDDDSFTGGTMRHLIAALGPGISVVERSAATADDDDEEIADSRDFLLASNDGGLVIELPDGSVGRAPYVLPYVDPTTRFGLAPDAAISFSVAVWDLNAQVFESTAAVVDDLAAAASAVLQAAGHEGGDTVAAVCRWHVEQLEARRPIQR